MLGTDSLNPISTSVDDIGRTMKASKQRWKWIIEDNKCIIELELFVSKISGKRKIFVNQHLIHQSHKLRNNYNK